MSSILNIAVFVIIMVLSSPAIFANSSWKLILWVAVFGAVINVIGFLIREDK